MSEYLSDEEQVARMKSWWGEYGTTVLVSVGIAIVLIAGSRIYTNQVEGSIAAASDAYQAYLSSTGDEQQKLADALKVEHSGTAYHVFVLLDEAATEVEDGALDKAQTSLKNAVDASPHALLADLARIRLAKVQYGLNLSEQSLSTLAGVSEEGYRALALETKGDIHTAMGQIEQAYEAYSAATAALSADATRPILEMKLQNTAPFEGQFVTIQGSGLEEALQAAEAALEDVATEAAGDVESNVEANVEQAEQSNEVDEVHSAQDTSDASDPGDG